MLTPNVYCLENIETSQDGNYESSQADFDSYEENNENAVEKEETSEAISDLDSESVDDDSETASEDTVLTATSEDDIEPLGNAKAYLSPALENENDYFDASLFTGSFVYSYPIEALKGRAGLEPKVSLTYSSAMGSGGTYGSLGMGWSLNENCVIRDTRYTPDNTSDDRFILVLDGSTYKLVYVEEDESYHTEIESFMKIEKSTTGSNSFGDYWILKMPDGTKYRFGYNSDSEQRNSVESRNYVSKWWLDLIEDVNGNQIKYKYLENPKSGEIGSTYLDSITYNDNHAVIDFEFTEKPDSFTVYEYGNKICENSLISSITVQNDETILWEYDLDYNTQQSKLYLTSITKAGLNNAEFPPTIFEYGSIIEGWQESSSWISPIDFGGGRDRGERLVDINGDGLEDIIQGYIASNNAVCCSAWINTGDGWELNSSWETPTYFRHYTHDGGARLADVNGDGLVDIIQNGSYISSAWLNTGVGWEQNNSWTPPLDFGWSSDSGVRVLDINGDGLADIIKGYKSDYVHEYYDAYLNTGEGWIQDNSWNPPVCFSYDGSDQGIRLVDVNGDGLVDLVKYGSAWLNNGSGWEQDNSWGAPVSLLSIGICLADVNGDGLVDILKGYLYSEGSTYNAWINTGDGWEEKNSWNPPTLIGSYTKGLGVRFADLNGDGLTDIIQGNGLSCCYTWINTNTDSTEDYKTPGLLKKIQHPTGGSTTIKYEPSTNFDNTGNDGVSDLSMSMWVTSSVTRDNGITGTGRVVSTTNYTYKNGMQYFNPPEEIEFRGFGEVTVENEYSIIKHFFHQDNVLKGIENHTEVWDKNGNLYSSSNMEYTAQRTYPDVNLILLDSISKTQFDGLVKSPTSSAGWSSFIKYNEYDDYGNPLSITDYGDVNTTGDGKYLYYEYANAEGPWILGKKTHEWLKDSNQTKKSESWYYYDGTNDNSAISKGQLTKTISWNNMGDNPTVLYDYDNYGNIIQITNPEGASKNIEYDDNHLYPASIENALGQKECYEFNDLGRITKITDSNGISTAYVYDDLHRISKMLKVDDTLDSPSTEYTYYQDGVAPEKVLTKTKDCGSEENNYIVNGSIFKNYKTITISPSADGTLTDYQVSFDVAYEPEMQSDFDDVRFVDDNGIPLPYWIEEKTDSVSAKVWVKVPEIDGIHGTTINMYYGNSGVPSASNGNAVFDFFDDFESGVLDTAKWNTIGSPTIIDDSGDKVLRLTPNNDVNTFNKFSGTEYTVGGLMKFESFGYFGGPRMSLEVKEPNNQLARFSYRIESYPDGTGWTGTSITYASSSASFIPIAQARPSWSTGVWDRFSFSSSNNLQKLSSDKLNLSGTYANNLSGSIYIGTWDNGNDIRFSHIYVRKFASFEPTYVVGDTETGYDEGSTNTSYSYSTFDSTDSYDGFGQLIQKKYEGEDGWIIQNTAYNELGLVESAEVPHYSDQSGLSVTYEYDATGRPTVITNTDGTTLRYHYKLDNTTITNQNGVNKTLTSDVFGNVVRVYEFNGNETYVTSYGYDALNSLIEISPGCNDPQMPPSVYFTYDSLGRKVAMNDPDMGSWTYEYDLNGNLVNQTDARGVSTILSYDDLGRVTSIYYPNDEDVSFTYDLKFNGTLSKVKKGNVSSDYNYDLRYRVKDEAVTIDGTRYTTSYKYDSMDRVIRITYPNAASVNLRYNNQTLLESVEGVIDNLDYNARNQITRKEYSNGVVTTYTYDSQKLLLDRIYSAGLQDLNYDFDNVGNVLQIVDNAQNSVKTYGYDDLDRLVSAEMYSGSRVNLNYLIDFTYDQYGRIEINDATYGPVPFIEETALYEYSLTPFHAPVTYSVGSLGYDTNDLDYDANGNLIDDEDFIYVYNDANQLSEVRYSANNSLVEKYWYDANGQRIKKQNSTGEFTYYVNKFYEIENGTVISYFFLNDERIAKKTSEGMEWYLSDHLGSTSLMIDENGVEVERTDYFPYGQVRSGGLEKYGFTGQENDADTGLMYYGARYYSPEYSIFVQPDTMLPDPYNPQVLNRYSYALNNPVKYSDPSGHYVESALDVAFILMDLNDIRQDPSDLWAWGALGADGVCAVVPIATGGGLGVKAIKATNGIDNAVDTTKAIEKSVEVVDTVADAGKAVDNVGDTLKVSDNVPESLMVGEANTYVYYGVRDGENVYVGITNNPTKRIYQHGDRFDVLYVLNRGEPLTRKQSRAIEQAEIVSNPSFENKINSISPNRDFYDKAVEWGQNWLKGNGYKR
ncbi:DUF2341 domain-containing protein [Methanosarcina horonobensis]|uniref:DUF2341 domain-containing protein n=1 Tax=Methanosarcina horonobensis TaxID=418008 RepID=UPI00064EEB68|nr:DUF2341 domain-containing protein [Methanosarcina horonobensis]